MIKVDGRKMEPILILRTEILVRGDDGNLTKWKAGQEKEIYRVSVIDRETGESYRAYDFRSDRDARAFVCGMEQLGEAQTEEHAGMKEVKA
jgi:hypothetical protein